METTSRWRSYYNFEPLTAYRTAYSPYLLCNHRASFKHALFSVVAPEGRAILTCETQTVHHYCRTQIHGRSLAEGCRCQASSSAFRKEESFIVTKLLLAQCFSCYAYTPELQVSLVSFPTCLELYTYLRWKYRNDVTISRDFLLTQQVSVNDTCWSLLGA